MSNFIPNSFQLPNAFVDSMLDKVSGNACKIYLVIVRKTRGWHKESDRLSYSQLLKITGIGSYSTIEKAIDELLSIGLINVKTGNVKASNEYSLNDNFCSTTESVVGQATTETVGATTKTVAEGTTETVDTKDTIKTTNKKTHSASEPTPDYPDFENKADDRFKNFDGLGYKTIPDHWKQTALAKYPELNEQSLNDLFNGIEAHYQPQTGRKHTDAQWNGHWGKWLANNASMAIRKQPKASQQSAIQPIGAAYQPAPQPERKRNPVPPPKGMFDGLFGGVFS